MTMISFKRTGGSMGNEVNMDFELENMPANLGHRLQTLLLESNFFEIPVINDLLTQPDEYEYLITVVAGNSLHTVHVSDTSMPKALRPLVDELMQLSKAT